MIISVAGIISMVGIISVAVQEVQWGMGASALFRIFFKMESFFRFSLSSTRKTVFSGTRNAVFRKRSPERSFFENAGLSFLCGRTKTEAFENDHVIHVHLSYIIVEGKGYYRMSFIISNCPVEGQKRGIRYMCTRILFRKRRKNLRF